MDKFKRFEIWGTLAMLGFLATFAVIGAFWGAEKTAAIINSPPLAIYWLLLTALLLAGLATFPRLTQVPSSLLMHLGCVIILVGAMWGQLAWGDYWGWDPKELWSLVCWLIYLGYFHFNYITGKKIPELKAGS